LYYCFGWWCVGIVVVVYISDDGVISVVAVNSVVAIVVRSVDAGVVDVLYLRC